jgi:hypothetical protein
LREQQAGENLGRRADLEYARRVRLLFAAVEPGLTFATIEPASGDLRIDAGVDPVLQVTAILVDRNRLCLRSQGRKGKQQRQ